MKIYNFKMFVVSAVWLCATSNGARAEDKYYMLIFGSQTEPNLPRLSHTYGLFVKTSERMKRSKKTITETRCISWMPQSLVIQPIRLRPVPGANLDLAASLQWARSNGLQTTMWGPFPIEKALFDMAGVQERRLRAGRMEYLMIDGRFRGNGASNCIHALSDLDETQELLETGTAHGNEASEMALRHFERYIIPNRKSPIWLVDTLNLKRAQVQFATPVLAEPDASTVTKEGQTKAESKGK